MTEYGQQIETLAKSPRYEQWVQALTCYKGIKNFFALTMIIEIGDVKRFPHPRQRDDQDSLGHHHRLGCWWWGYYSVQGTGDRGGD